MPARGRRDYDLTSPVSMRAACLGLAFHFAQLYAEEYDLDYASIALSATPSKGACRVTISSGACCTSLRTILEALKVVVGSVHVPLEVSWEEPLEPLRVSEVPYVIAELLVKSYAPKLLELSRREGRECFLVVGWNGAAVGGVGRERKVELPMLKALAIMHTHDAGCVPSPEDLRAASEFFAEGGLVDIIVGPSCAFAIYVTGPFTVDDYEALNVAAKRMKRAADEYEYMIALRSLESGNLRIAMWTV